MTGDPLYSPHQCRPRLISSTSLAAARTPARPHARPDQPPEATPCALGQSKSQPVNQINQLAAWHCISPRCRQPSSRRMPTQWAPLSLCPCRLGRAEFRQPPASSRSELQFPPPPTESETPRESKDENRGAGHHSRAAAVDKHHACLHWPRTASTPAWTLVGRLFAQCPSGQTRPGQAKPGLIRSDLIRSDLI